MPGHATYRYWRRTQVAFQAELWRLRGVRYARLGDQLRGSRWRDFDPAVADLILVRVARGEGWVRMLAADPSLPHRKAAERWRREQPQWDAAMRIALRVGRLARARARSRERCAVLTDEIGGRIVEGGSLRSVGQDAEMPCAETLYAWVARFPEFAAEVERACDLRHWWYADQMIDISLRNGPFGLAATKREAAPLQRRLNGLAKRPGWKRRSPG